MRQKNTMPQTLAGTSIYTKLSTKLYMKPCTKPCAKISAATTFFLLCSLQTAAASELVYEPVNPSFGGNPINGNYLLSNAQSQNDFKDPSSGSSAFSQRTALDRFTDSLESRMLNQLIGDIGEGNAGTLVTEDFIVDIVDEDGVLTVHITDLETNETSEITVSGLNPNN